MKSPRISLKRLRLARRFHRIGALCLAIAVRATAAWSDYALPFAGAESLQLRGGVIVGVFVTSLEDRALVAFRSSTGEQIARLDASGLVGFAFDGSQLVFTTGPAGRMTSYALATAQQTTLWEDPAVQAIGSPCLTALDAWTITRTGSTLRILQVPLSATAAKAKSSLSSALPSGEPARLLCAQNGDVLLVQANQCRILVQDDPSQPRLFTLPEDHAVVALAAGFVYAIDRSGSRTLVRRRLMAEAEQWERVYDAEPGTSVSAETVEIDVSREIVHFSERTRSDEVGLAEVSLRPDHTVTRWAMPSGKVLTDSALWSWHDHELVRIHRREGRLWLSTQRPRPIQSKPLTAAQGIKDPSRSALMWLDGQMGPVFQTRFDRPGRLMDSYEDDVRAGWVYDSAVAAIALSAWGRTVPARELLNGLEHLQREDGSWSFSYNPDTAAPLDSSVYIGSLAWVVMAANFYEWETKDPGFRAMAERALSFIGRFRAPLSGTRLHGAVSMGPASPQSYSIEHNVDCYSAFLWRGRIEANPTYLEVAGLIRDFVYRELWVDAPSNDRAFFKVGFTDASLYLDAQTWTALSLLSEREDLERFRRAVETAERALRVDQGRIGGLRGVLGFRESEAAPSTVWFEGNEGVVAALLALGQVDRARSYHLQTQRYQDGGGGIPYATDNDEGWSTKPSVAGTAWFLLNRLWPPRNPFQPDVAEWLRAHRRLAPMLPEPSTAEGRSGNSYDPALDAVGIECSVP